MGVEWGQYGIRMNCIAPGPIYTEGAFSRLDPSGTMINQAVKAIPTGRLGEVEEIANLATYMCRYVLCAVGRPAQFFWNSFSNFTLHSGIGVPSGHIFPLMVAFAGKHTKAHGIRHNWLSGLRNTLRLELGTIQNGDVGIRHKFLTDC